MQRIPMTSVVQWAKAENRWYPASIAIKCGHCGEKVTMAVSNQRVFADIEASILPVKCPGCRNQSILFHVGCGDASDRSQQTYGDLALHPDPKLPRERIEGISLLPDALRQTYEEALAVFDAAVWRATVTCCRVTLEAITAQLVPAEEGPLHQRIEALSKKTEDLAAPILELAHLVRKTGNLGAHFDPAGTEVTKQMAEAQMRLVEYLLEYVFTLPKLIGELKKESGHT